MLGALVGKVLLDQLIWWGWEWGGVFTVTNALFKIEVQGKIDTLCACGDITTQGWVPARVYIA